MIDRIFEIVTELDENQVTLSPAMVKHMLKHNRHGRNELVVMPVKPKDAGDGLIGLDVNPPYDVADAIYQQSLSRIQYDPKSKCTGYQMEDPTVLGMWCQYGIDLENDPKNVEGMTMTMQVQALKMGGRWIYWILRPTADEEEKKWRARRLRWTAWLVKFGIL